MCFQRVIGTWEQLTKKYRECQCHTYSAKKAPWKQDETYRQVNNLVKEEMGCDSNSPWLSPVILVTKCKKQASQKLCLDHRQLDSVTVKDAISQPRINDSLDGPSGTSGISTLDVWHPGKGRLALEGLQALSYVKLHKRWTIRNEIAYHLD